MKIVKGILVVLFLCLVLLIQVSPVYGSLPLIGRVIVIDPGHGGIDPGTLKNEVLEKDINLKISKYLDEELTKYGATVIMTREGDYDLSKPNTTWRKKSDFDNRIDLINNSDADIYLSIHLNYLNDSSYYGPQIFYGEDSEYLAETIQDELNKNLDTNRDIKQIPSDTYMYKNLNIKGVLIECGFISNYEERMKLITDEYQKKLAMLIANSIVDYY